jgi:hypothetical protein
MQAVDQTGQITSGRLLACVDRMLAERPEQRASILRRLRETQPELYALWLMRAAAAPRAAL